MDQVVSEVAAALGPDDTLMVLSDHGFKTFRHGVDLNYWLEQNGYLKIAEGGDRKKKYLANVDFSQTRAFAIGLAGVYLIYPCWL